MGVVHASTNGAQNTSELDKVRHLCMSAHVPHTLHNVAVEGEVCEGVGGLWLVHRYAPLCKKLTVDILWKVRHASQSNEEQHLRWVL